MKASLSSWMMIILLTLLCQSAGAQGTIQGSVADSASKAPLIGANVYVRGTALGAVTNREGEYRIERVPAGTYVLRVSYLGYSAREFHVQVSDNAATRLDARLIQSMIEGTEVIVTAQARGQVSAINQQLTSPTIINVVSEEKIQELPDANAAEAIGRLPGVSIIRSGGEANRVVLRGLSDKYSTFTLDGMRLAPTDADSRGVDLSTISQSSLAGVELYKALTPDKDGDAIAGGVNLVTKKAPAARLLWLDARGAYNRLNNTFGQYNFGLRYGERFFSDIVGVQVTGNLERRDRSNEQVDLTYNQNRDGRGTDWEITDFTPQYINEARKRNGIGLIFDVNTPDSGSIKINNSFSATKREYTTYTRNYPTTGTIDLLYTARDQEQDINMFNSSIRGDNFLLGLNTTWGVSFAQSLAKTPYDYSIDFREPSTLDDSGHAASRMKPLPENVLKGPPELLVPYALNNFQTAYLNWSYFRSEKNLDKEKGAFLDLSRKYLLGDMVSWEIKIGGKYRHKNRFLENGELASAYYIDPFRLYTIAPDGSVQKKDFSGTRFANLQTDNNKVLATNFLDPIPANRNVYDKYNLYPLINRDALRLWYELNKHGVATPAGQDAEYKVNNEVSSDYYDIVERVGAGYIMNTVDIGQDLTFIGGVRVETEKNDYLSKYAPNPLTGFPTPAGLIKDTSAVHRETIWLPSLHLTWRAFDFLNIRLAAYRGLARPDFNLRLERYIARNSGAQFGPNVVSLWVGNPNLRAAKAWNYEVNTSFFNNTVGLISLSAFYKDITDMNHMLNGVQTSGRRLLDSLGITWKAPFADGVLYALSYPYNSSRPTHVWGFEAEWQANLGFLPGLLQNIVLSANASIVRSETYVISSSIVMDTVIVPGFPFPVLNPRTVITEVKQRMEGQPETFGNVAIGYDIGGFSARLSVYYQGEFNNLFSADQRNDLVTNSFSRWDFIVRQRLTNNISLMFTVNNFTNVEEGNYIANRITGWNLLDTSQKYGLAAEMGARIEF